MTTLLLTGATGSVGGQAALGARDAGAHVRVLVRDPSSSRVPAGVEVVPGDLRDPSSVAAAAEGVDGVLLVWPLGSSEGARDVVEALPGGAHVTYLSSLGIVDGAARQADPITQFHAELEALVQGSGRPWTFLRPSGFATNTLGWAASIRAEGVVRAPVPRCSRSLIDERDMADVAVAALLDPSSHSGRTHRITGPASLTHVEQVAALAEGLGRPLRYEELPPGEARRDFAAMFGSEGVADGVLKAWTAFATDPEPVTSGVLEVTGRPARPLTAWAAFHAADFAPAD